MTRSDGSPRAGRSHLWGPWPDPRQTLLLHAALDSGPPALRAWERFGADGALPDIDPGTYRLLPLAYRNLITQGASASELVRLRGVYKHAWYQNTIQLRSGTQALDALHAAGLRTMVLKGAALITGEYGDIGARPMDDFDVLVPVDQAPQAIAILRREGWTADDPHPETAVGRHHATSFRHELKGDLDLHWNLQWEAIDDRSVWAAAEPTTVLGVATERLSPADQLLHVCVHGSRANVISPIRWIADSIVLLRRHGSDFDWDRLADRAVERRLTVTAHATLRYLRDAFDAPVPDGPLRALKQARASIVEHCGHRARVSPGLPGRKLAIVWERYDRLAGAPGRPASPRAMVAFLQQLWGLERRRELPVEAVRRVLEHRLWGRLDPEAVARVPAAHPEP